LLAQLVHAISTQVLALSLQALPAKAAWSYSLQEHAGIRATQTIRQLSEET